MENEEYLSFKNLFKCHSFSGPISNHADIGSVILRIEVYTSILHFKDFFPLTSKLLNFRQTRFVFH